MPRLGVIGAATNPVFTSPATAVYVVGPGVYLGACRRCIGAMVLALDNGDGQYQMECLTCGNVVYQR